MKSRDLEMLVGARGVAVPEPGDLFASEFAGRCCGVRKGLLKIVDQDDNVFEVTPRQFTCVAWSGTVEFLVAWPDNTWTTHRHAVEVALAEGSALISACVEWALKNLARKGVYRKAVLFAVYHISQEEE